MVSKAFTPHAVEAMRPHIQALVDQFLDRVRLLGAHGPRSPQDRLRPA